MFSLNQRNCVITQFLENTCSDCTCTWETYYLVTAIPSWSWMTVHHPVSLPWAIVSFSLKPSFNPPINHCSFELGSRFSRSIFIPVVIFFSIVISFAAILYLLYLSATVNLIVFCNSRWVFKTIIFLFGFVFYLLYTGIFFSLHIIKKKKPPHRNLCKQ